MLTELRSLFLPASDKKPEASSSSSSSVSSKASVSLFGGHWPTSEPSTASATTTTATCANTSGHISPQSNTGSFRLSNYVADTSLLCPTPAKSLVTVLRSGAVEVFSLADASKGPFIAHTIPSPNAAAAMLLGLSSGPNGAMHGEGFKSKVTCAALIPSEIALRQRAEEVGYITPGPCQPHHNPQRSSSPSNNNNTNNNNIAAVALNTGITASASNMYSPPASARGSLMLMQQEASRSGAASRSASHPHTSSSPTSSNVPNAAGGAAFPQLGAVGGGNMRSPPSTSSVDSSADIARFSDEDWRRMVGGLWRGVVGTMNGEVMVFDGTKYVLAFRCTTPTPVLQVACVLLPADGDGDSSASLSNSTNTNRNAKRGKRGGITSPPASSLSLRDMGTRSRTAGSTYGAVPAPSAYFSVGFVTLQRDGSVLCWRRPRADGGFKVSPKPVTIQSASMFAKVKTIHVTHKFTIPMALGNKTPHFPTGIETFVDEQRAVGGTRPQRNANVTAVALRQAAEYSDEYGGGGGQQQSSSPTAGAAGAGGGTLANIPLRDHDSFYAWHSTISGFSPEPLPLMSVVFLPENGLGGNVSIRDACGRRVDEDVLLDGKLKRTTAIHCDGNNAVFAREKNLFMIDYSIREVRRVFSTNSIITHVCYSHPIAIAGCENGNIFVLGAQTGAVLAEYSTYNNSKVRDLAFHYQSMLLAVVDDAKGEIEVVQLPSSFLRHGTLPQEKYYTRQTAALKFGIVASEASNNVVTKRNAMEQRLIAQLSVPGCVQQYLSHTHILK